MPTLKPASASMFTMTLSEVYLAIRMLSYAQVIINIQWEIALC